MCVRPCVCRQVCAFVCVCVCVYVDIDQIHTLVKFKLSRLSSFHDSCQKPLFRDLTSQIVK